MDVFDLRRRLIDDYSSYIRSFLNIADERLRAHVEIELQEGLLWPHPLIQLNPAFEPGGTIDSLIDEKVLHPACRDIFRIAKSETKPGGRQLRLHKHQVEAIRIAQTGRPYVLTTGTGSGKSLAYIIPIVDHVLRRGPGKGIQAVVVYPMNALANSQHGELTKFLKIGYPAGVPPVRFERYTGQEDQAEKQRIVENPPDILLTNYVMLELILTRVYERKLVDRARGLRFLVLDELHTYRGRQGADVALLMRRAREAFDAPQCQFVGTSATLGGEGTYAERRVRIAAVASRIFGAPVGPDEVIGETLRRVTPERSTADAAFVEALRDTLKSEQQPPVAYSAYASSPFSSWIESTFGIRRDEGGRLERAQPRRIDGPEGAAADLAKLTGIGEGASADGIRRWLLGAYGAERDPDTDQPIFAFRVHQFLSRGDTAYATLEAPAHRHLTMEAQRTAPDGSADRVLFPLVFCRECGQDYYSVSRTKTEEGQTIIVPRALMDFGASDDAEPGYLFISTANPWPAGGDALLQRLPEDWLEEHNGALRVRRDRRPDLPESLRLEPDGRATGAGVEAQWIAQPFRFCLRCGVSYAFSWRSDFAKLAGLGTGGRTMATTLMALSVIRSLREQALQTKLLSFTDNRQDASLQAGHLNDFVEVILLRSGLYRACVDAGADGLAYDVVRQRVFDALALPFEMYARDPSIEFGRDDVHRALKDVLAYRLYRDLEHGWRITSPNLEQCGLLEIGYRDLDAICAAQSLWQDRHHALVSAPVETRIRVVRTLLDYIRRELAIDVDVLKRDTFDQIRQRSDQNLAGAWALDEQEVFISAKTLYLRPAAGAIPDIRDALWLSPRGAFGQYIRRMLGGNAGLGLGERETICRDLIEILKKGNLVQATPPIHGHMGYQLKASALRWRVGDGTQPVPDPLRKPHLPEGGARTNPFFVRVYRELASELYGIEAREHTAQVQADIREEREKEFRAARLPILFCSPTMELGVDIAELNVVNMRNVPPTPANYAQRSGRAGRSGQPALVFTYCTTGSSHDQYFFRQPQQMVSGQVLPPRLDLANEDLIRSHVHAIWLAEARLDLNDSLISILDMAGDPPALTVLPSVLASLNDMNARARAQQRARRILDDMKSELAGAEWLTPDWLEHALGRVPLEFERACDRWRTLYRSAHQQRALQHKIVGDHTRPQHERDRAKALRQEAETQLSLLTDIRSVMQSDFYSYRYFATEGFLPGYNFPRLPLSAYIPGRRTRKGRDEFLTRPRFLAISEFGPRAIVYHEGSRYRIHRVILPIPETPTEIPVPFTRAKFCDSCGYLHRLVDGPGPDRCERCDELLPQARTNLFRLQNVSTRRRDKITCDEEERLRLGYILRTRVRFAQQESGPAYSTAVLRRDGETLATIGYGPAATIWRLNLGWRRTGQETGFHLDVEKGTWGNNQNDPDDQEAEGLGARVVQVVPYVEDRRNVLLVEPAKALSREVMASLQAALKAAIQIRFQLEELELAAEALPDERSRQLILLYESSEGGAGVLRRLIEPHALREVARQALRLCHFDPDTGADQRRAPHAREECQTACYDCLMSYTNQPDHRLLSRHAIKDALLQLAGSETVASPMPISRAEHLAKLKANADSDLERAWLDAVEKRGLKLPSRAQRFIEACATKPDFVYDDSFTVIYVDGLHHKYPDRVRRDVALQTCLENEGYTVLRFADEPTWDGVFAAHPDVFGRGKHAV